MKFFFLAFSLEMNIDDCIKSKLWSLLFLLQQVMILCVLFDVIIRWEILKKLKLKFFVISANNIFAPVFTQKLLRMPRGVTLQIHNQILLNWDLSQQTNKNKETHFV